MTHKSPNSQQELNLGRQGDGYKSLLPHNHGGLSCVTTDNYNTHTHSHILILMTGQGILKTAVKYKGY